MPSSGGRLSRTIVAATVVVGVPASTCSAVLEAATVLEGVVAGA